MKRFVAVLIAVAIAASAVSCSNDDLTSPGAEDPGLPRVVASFEQFTEARFAKQPFEDMTAEFAMVKPEPESTAQECVSRDGTDQNLECIEFGVYVNQAKIYAAWQVEVVQFHENGGKLPAGRFFEMTPPRNVFNPSSLETVAIASIAIDESVKVTWYCTWLDSAKRYEASGDDFGYYIAVGQLNRYLDDSMAIQENDFEAGYQRYLEQSEIGYRDWSYMCDQG